MLRQKLSFIPFAITLAFSILLVGCSGSDSGVGTSGETGTLEVQMHDAPANYEEVNIFVKSVEVNNADTDTGWVVINEPQQTYDLLELTNGATTVLGSKELETGTYEQIRLIVKVDQSYIVVDGKSHNLFVPGGNETGVKLPVNAEIKPDITYTLLLDFDAARSVVERGNEQSGISYLLQPVISASNQAETGNIAGTVEPVDANPFVYAIAADDTLSSTKADTSDGSFKLIGLEEGTYTVSVDPTNDTYQASDTSGVDVTVDKTNELGTIQLSQN
ncbi:DUF4382 domain-containing protein [Fodinibius halophilus]|uniref:DUF4382 domain-containing protein n=1 Tax=Fodinibius halophilus TaxID=1736908 RepID=A0A6M1T0S5_9BACT|nr:DUF4382 domain-containing protein [Fodinibius halophilus]NGP86815.1 DUF4382 domain-containing protein [Fodinibius halophilus]